MAQLRTPVTDADHRLGDDTAPVTLVEYGDYQCPYCAAAQPIVEQILDEFGDEVRLVYRHFPLVEMHPFAEPAAEAAEFAGSRGHFWEMHQALFENQNSLSPQLLMAIAGQLPLSPDALREALVAGNFAPKVRNDFIGGVRSGVNGTPTFFLNGIRHDSPYGPAALGPAIAQLTGRSARRA